MGRLIALIIGLAALAFAVKYALEPARNGGAPDGEAWKLLDDNRTKPRPPGTGEHTRPREQLDNVRDKAHDLERQMQKAADDAARNTDQR